MEQRITNTDAHRGHIKTTGSPEYDKCFIALESSFDSYSNEWNSESPIQTHKEATSKPAHQNMTKVLLPALHPVASQPLQHRRLYNLTTKKYCNMCEILRFCPHFAVSTTTQLSLELGGGVSIYPNLIDKQERDTITSEILQYRHHYDDSSKDKNKIKEVGSKMRKAIYHCFNNNEFKVVMNLVCIVCCIPKPLWHLHWIWMTPKMARRLNPAIDTETSL